MITGLNYVAGKRTGAQSKTLTNDSPLGDSLGGTFHVASTEDVNQAVNEATKAFQSYRTTSGAQRANFLEEIANEIEALGDDLLNQAHQEAGLPLARFTGERGRTMGQLRAFAAHLREGSWVNATIDTAQPDRKPMPKADIRRMLIPIGPVVVFTASNFPLAFSTAGGDTASALASGCPVIVKAHESHLGVNEMVAGAITRAAEKTGMPKGVFSSLNGDGFETGQSLVMHPQVKAVAFTGSLRGGKAIYDLAQSRPEPIPVFAEMGSINPVVLMEDKLADADALASTISSSVTMGVGQFCTNPGLLIAVKSEHLSNFRTHLTDKLNQCQMATMLNQGIQANYDRLRTTQIKSTDLCTESGHGPTLVRTNAANFIQSAELKEEVFGPFTLLVECENEAEIVEVIHALEGQLTGTIMTDAPNNAKAIIEALTLKVGRLVFNAAPTGVEVCDSMVHGGPYPASTDARTTSVGTSAITRFARPMCYQGMPNSLLPAELQDENPLQITRVVNGSFEK